MIQKIKITSEMGRTRIEVDGHEIDGVKTMCLHQEVGEELPTLYLGLRALDIEVDAEADVIITNRRKEKS